MNLTPTTAVSASIEYDEPDCREYLANVAIGRDEILQAIRDQSSQDRATKAPFCEPTIISTAYFDWVLLSSGVLEEGFKLFESPAKKMFNEGLSGFYYRELFGDYSQVALTPDECLEVFRFYFCSGVSPTNGGNQ